ncbi:Uncharacterised protein [Plesiomonas shigelloides]|nr:Uncharacterised protein [Plesiomonas shigelloides]
MEVSAYNAVMLEDSIVINVYIDNNIWDFIFKNGLNLRDYFPAEKYRILISKHGRFEITQMPDTPDKIDFKNYILSVLAGDVEELHTFGFSNPAHSESEQRNSGFGMGAFTSVRVNEERERLKSEYGVTQKRKESLILNKQEADIELGALSLTNFVLTLDKKDGPLKSASENGGNVIFLNEICHNSGSEALIFAVKLIESKT